MATRSSILAWKMLWTEELGWLQTMGFASPICKTVEHDLAAKQQQYSIVYMYHSFLIHPSAEGHVGCFHVLAIINSATMNIGVHVSLSILPVPFCFDYYSIVK